MKGRSPIADRKLIQWVAAYVAVAWAVLQGADLLGGMWSWSAGVGRVAFALLAAGLGIAIVLAWFHGERGRQRVSATEGALLAIFVIAGVGGAAAAWHSRPELPEGSSVGAPSGMPASTLAVLPFQDLSPEGGRGYLGDGIAETLISSLARLGALKVVARTSAFAFRDSGDVREIGRRLGAGSIVEGTVAQLGSRVRITASLVDTNSGENLWAARFDDEVDEADLFELQDEVARKIVDALRIHLADGGRIVHGGTRSPEAQRAYYLGVHHWTLRTTEDMQKATDLFREAIAADSSYAEAWGGLALSYNLSTPQEYAVPGISRAEALDRAEAAARHALTLDPDLPSAYTALGDASVQRGNLDQGEHWFREAIRVGPGYATAHHWLADLLMLKLDGEGALAQIDLAESLDPVAPAILVERGEALMMLGRHADAFAQMDKAIALLPDAELVRTFAAYFFMKLRAWDDVAEQLRRLSELGGSSQEGARLADALTDPERRPTLLRELVAAGAVQDSGDSFTSRWGLRGGGSSVAEQLMRRPEMRFLVTLEVKGMDAALDLLESLATGPEAAELYPPIFPALIGPEALRTERAQEVMRLVAQRR
ncbi:MAG: tetratricopeptide repeat protein [Gemmatimonadetes bacterium]|nr:tetratricopeptide repeat protein [Gemmatimonadota bacterium]